MFAAPTVQVVPISANSAFDQWKSPGASHIPPAAVQSTSEERRGLVSWTKSESVGEAVAAALAFIRGPGQARG